MILCFDGLKFCELSMVMEHAVREKLLVIRASILVLQRYLCLSQEHILLGEPAFLFGINLQILLGHILCHVLVSAL